jgi:hypothetical protein
VPHTSRPFGLRPREPHSTTNARNRGCALGGRVKLVLISCPQCSLPCRPGRPDRPRFSDHPSCRCPRELQWAGRPKSTDRRAQSRVRSPCAPQVPARALSVRPEADDAACSPALNGRNRSGRNASPHVGLTASTPSASDTRARCGPLRRAGEAGWTDRRASGRSNRRPDPSGPRRPDCLRETRACPLRVEDCIGARRFTVERTDSLRPSSGDAHRFASRGFSSTPSRSFAAATHARVASSGRREDFCARNAQSTES